MTAVPGARSPCVRRLRIRAILQPSISSTGASKTNPKPVSTAFVILLWKRRFIANVYGIIRSCWAPNRYVRSTLLHSTHRSRMKGCDAPHVVESIELNGVVVYRHDSKSSVAIKSVDRAAFYQLKTMLQGVLARGTARAIAGLSPYVAGKTGT